MRGIGPRRNADIQRIDEPMLSRIVDANLPRLADRRRARKSYDEMRIGIDAHRTIRRIHTDAALSRSQSAAQKHKQGNNQPTTHRHSEPPGAVSSRPKKY